jgi:hypothetical protein
MPWTPLPHEADLFCNVYIDESSQTKHRYLVLGALVVPLSHADAFEADMIAARDYFSFPKRHKLPASKNVDIHCVAVDTSKKTLKATGDGDIEIGFNKEVYFLCTVVVGKRFKTELFHIYPDRRNTKHKLIDAQRIMNYGAKKHGDKRLWPYRRLRFEDPEKRQALQVVDIFIGALAYRLNGHYDKPEANLAKKSLSDHILGRVQMTNPFVRSAYYKRRFTVIHREGTKYVPKR